MPPEKRTPRETLEVLEAMEMRDLAEEIAAMSNEEVAKSIAADGGDARAIGERGAKLVASLIQRRKDLMWQVEARAGVEAEHAKLAALPVRPRLSRDEMKKRVDAARGDTEFAVLLAARKGGTDEATDDELDDLLGQLEMLRARRDAKT